jgi:hypothetical protein
MLLASFGPESDAELERHLLAGFPAGAAELASDVPRLLVVLACGVPDGGSDQEQVALVEAGVEAGDGVAEVHEVTGGEAGCYPQDAFFPPEDGRWPLSRAMIAASQSIHARGVLSLMLASMCRWRELVAVRGRPGIGRGCRQEADARQSGDGTDRPAPGLDLF